MKYKGLLTRLGILLPIVLFIKLYSANAERVENGFSTGLYPRLGALLRLLFGWIPFSIGDILYGWLFCWLLWKIYQGVRTIVLQKITWKSFRAGLVRKTLKAFTFFLLLYVIFYAVWGINYKRKGIADQLGLRIEKYSLTDLRDLNSMLVQKVNAARGSLTLKDFNYPASRQLFYRAGVAYDSLAAVYPFLKYKHASVKTSLFGWLGNYLGFGGYYNPFTGEAQVNTTMPAFLLPYTTCHEMAHQLGYAREMEANFVGYLAAVASPDTQFHYSVYLDLFIYSNRNLFRTDSLAAREFVRQLIPGVKDDIKEWREFSMRHRNPVEPVFKWIYGKYLENNEQPQGMLSYDEVTGFLIAYFKKFGKI